MNLARTRRLAGLVALALGYLALALAAEALATETQRVIAFWPAGGLLLSALLLCDTRRWPEICAAGVAGAAAFNLRTDPADVTAALVLADLAVPLLGAALVRRSVGRRLDVGQIRHVLALCLVAGVAAPALGAVVAAAGLELTAAPDLDRVWLTFFLANSVGVIAVAPLALGLADFTRHPNRRRGIIEIGCLAALSAAVALVFVFTDLPLTWLAVLIPVVAALRRGVLGSAAAFLPVTVIAVLATTHDHGAFAASVDSDADAIALVQVFIGAAGTLCHLLGAASGQLELTIVGLRRSEDRFRILVDGVRDHAIFTLDAGGRVDSWNASAKRLFGYRHSEVIGERLPQLAAGAGVPILRAGIERARSSGRFEGEVGVRRADGVTFLGCFTLAPLPGADSGFAVVVRDVTESRRTERQLRRMALHDPLTGLPNRALLTDRLKVALASVERDGGCVAVLFCDLDRFKLINDSLGHEAGDTVLAAVARRLREVVRPEDTVARFGGDEFVVCCRQVDDAQHAVRLAERVRAQFAEPIEVGDEQLYTSGSIGIAIGGVGTPPEDLLRAADTAMYRAKQGGAGYALADDADRTRAIDRLRGETAVRRALERGQLVLHYQPIVDMRERRVVALEALLRWNHPDEGLLLPGEFIGVAEETGAILPIGAWVAREACAAGSRLRAASPDAADLVVNVNVSARQIAADDLVTNVARALADTGTEPRLLCLELTETELIDDLQQYGAVLARLARLGVRLAIDDFGAGYSSLRYLSRLPIQTVKLDRSFVSDLDGAEGGAPILRAAVSMARAFELDAVAEGVEHAAEEEALMTMGYRLAQGFHFARPMPERDVAELLAGYPPLKPMRGSFDASLT